jgi:hypothetical protein
VNFLKSKTFKAIVAIIATALTAWATQGCSAASRYAPPPGRALCYAAADQAAQARVDAECGPVPDAGVSSDECPALHDIVAELQRNQEACK